jgi:predicted negative regulator of RcsB-dependent stress response
LPQHHISRRELKTDEVRETFAHGAEAVLSHKGLTLYLVAVALIVVIGVFGWRTYMERQTVKASAGYDDAMTAFQARVPVPGDPPATSGEVSFPNDTAKYTDAARKFSDLSAKYPRTRFGTLAKYYAALCDDHLSKEDDAKKLLQEVSGSSDADFAAMSRFQLAQIEDRTGQGDDAAKLYQQVIDKPSVFVPKAVAMLALAQHYAQKDPTQAAKLFGQIKSDYPDTPIAQQADQGLSLLPGKS